jgi:hypothetical protein
VVLDAVLREQVVQEGIPVMVIHRSSGPLIAWLRVWEVVGTGFVANDEEMVKSISRPWIIVVA